MCGIRLIFYGLLKRVAVPVTGLPFIFKAISPFNAPRGTRKVANLTKSMRKLEILRMIAAACENGGAFDIDVDLEMRRDLMPEIARIGAARKAIIEITGHPGNFRVAVKPSPSRLAPAKVDGRGRKPGDESQKIAALARGESVTFTLGTRSLDSINQKIHVHQRAHQGVKLTRSFDKTSNTVTITRIDGDEPHKPVKRVTKYSILSDMKAGEVVFIEDLSSLAQVRSACLHHSKSRDDTILQAFESTYDDAIEVHCMPIDAASKEAKQARAAIKKRLIERVFIKDGVILDDGSFAGSCDGSSYDGLEFYRGQADDILEILPAGQTIKIGGTPEVMLKRVADRWAKERKLKAIVSGNTVRFE